MTNRIKTIFSAMLLIGIGLMTPVQTIAQEAAAAADAAAPVAKAVKASPYQDPVFYTLCALAVILLIFILQMQKVLVGVGVHYAKSKKENGSNGGTAAMAILALIGLSLLPSASFAATEAPEQVPFLHHGFGSNAINALVVLIVVEVAVLLYYVRMIRLFIAKKEAEMPYYEAKPAPSFWEKFNASVAIEEEAAILTDHDYDGIQELDNQLPPWWKYGFYLTIIWAAFYLVHFHVTHAGPLQLDEYQNQLTTAEQEMAEYRKTAANLVDETNVKYLEDAGELAKGKEIFEKNCTPCHGPQAQGAQVGPNLTDNYWIHGGAMGDIFKTIKNGVQGKGMKSWKNDLTPSMIAQVSSYIKSLKGSNPPNAKAPDGTLFEEGAATAAPAPTDTTATTTAPADTLNTPAPAAAAGH